MKLRRIMIAAPKSGSGKTTVTCALLQALKERGQQVISCKCGPDYIDPMFHEKVIGVPSRNLDTFFTGEAETRRLFLKDRAEQDFVVLEGVMGLFDGLGGIREEGSSYHLAEVTKTPIVLVVDTKGMGRSLIPMLAGFLAYDKKHLIRGVILNRMSKGYYEILKPLAEQELGIRVLGYLPERKERKIKSRHLGLVMPEELQDLKKQLEQNAAELAETISLESLMQIAETAEELSAGPCPEPDRRMTGQRPVIAVARDEAFCFYYEENLSLLREKGAELRYFSPIRDEKLPKGCSGLLLGGGYPELYAKQLSENEAMRRAIKQAFENGMPMVAECGGFLYLHSELQDHEGIVYPMAGVLPGTCMDMGKLVRFGYVELREPKSRFLPEKEIIKGHEFHYYDSTDNGESCIARKPVTGREYPCIMEGEHYWFGFPHLYYPSNPKFPRAFVEMAQEFVIERKFDTKKS